MWFVGCSVRWNSGCRRSASASKPVLGQIRRSTKVGPDSMKLLTKPRKGSDAVPGPSTSGAVFLAVEVPISGVSKYASRRKSLPFHSGANGPLPNKRERDQIQP